MTQREEWPRIAVVGAGAVGGYFGGMFARAGAPIIMIGRKAFVEAVGVDGLLIDKTDGEERIKISATTDMNAIRESSLILFCVKANDTSATTNQMAPFLAPNATVVCLQNGVDNAERVRAVAKVPVIPAAVYIAVSVPRPGVVKHLARGDLIIGPPSEKTRELATVFERAGIPCRISNNIDGELWVKLLCNCALNAISALGHARYGQIAASADANKLMEQIVDEVLAVAKASHIVLPGIGDRESGMAAAMNIATQMSGALSSTAQDLGRGRPTEIDALNGYIAACGTKLGVPVPVNHAVFTLVKLAERRRDP